MRSRRLLLAFPAMVGIVAAAAVGCSRPTGARDVFPVPPSVRVLRDIVYAEYGQRQLKADVYLPPDGSRRGPVPGIIVVRGGAWKLGDKQAFGFIAGRLAADGFAAASIEYRTSAEAKFPAAIHDVKAAVRWMRARAADYGIDPNAIGAIGGSAGAHLVALLGTTSGVSELEGTGGNPSTSSDVQAVVAMACLANLDVPTEASQDITDFIGDGAARQGDRRKAASPASYVSSRSAALLLLHSETDPLVPFEQSVQMAALYQRAGATAVLQRIPAPKIHGFWNDPRYFLETMKAATAFFRQHLRTQ